MSSLVCEISELASTLLRMFCCHDLSCSIALAIYTQRSRYLDRLFASPIAEQTMPMTPVSGCSYGERLMAIRDLVTGSSIPRVDDEMAHTN